jgi:lysozyme
VKRWSLMWAAKFVARWEGFLPHAYLDTIASPAVYTIGYGHTGPDVHAGMVVSKTEALRLLAHDLRMAARAVKQGIHVKLAVRQRMALISLAFNCGAGAVVGSTLARKLNAGDYTGAGKCFLDWNHAGGVEVEGLTNRRRAEKWMFDHPKKRHKHNPHRPPNRKAHHR